MQPMRCMKLVREREAWEENCWGVEGILWRENWGVRKMLTEFHREGGGRPGNTLWGKSVAEGGNIMSPSRWGSSLVWLQRGKGSLWAGEAAEVEGQVVRGSGCPPKEFGLSLTLMRSSTRLLRRCVLAKLPCCSIDGRLSLKSGFGSTHVKIQVHY